MRMSPRNERINWEITNLLIPEYRNQYVDWDYEDYSWVHIKKRFKMPPGWSKNYTDLLVVIPESYPNVAPSNFYMDQHMQDSKGFSASHYFDKASGLNPYADRGWAWLCIHIQAWNPRTEVKRGDNLLTVCKLIYHTLSTGR